MKTRSVVVSAMLLSCAALPAFAQDEVITWDRLLRDTTRAIGGPPTPLSRSGAMLHTAMYDAVNSIEKTHQAYGGMVPASNSASQSAAAAAAAHRIMTNLYPSRAAIFDAQYATSLAAIAPGAARDEGVAVGLAAANNIIALRTGDGSEIVTPYVPGTNPGDWRPDPLHPGQSPATPGWGNVKPWAMTSGAMFRPPPPPALTSPEYAANVNEVKAYGQKNSVIRSAEQTLIGNFWGNDHDGTAKPPGHLNMITETISQMQGLSLAENARLYALTNISMADAGICAWDAKYGTAIDLWRPITAIREADTDGNPDTIADPTWEPELDFTPPFPAYTSGHATFGAAHAAALAAFFGTDSMTFTIGTDDGNVPLGYQRTFNSFSAMAIENAESRIYLGVHYRFDATFGNTCGNSIGDYVGDNLLLAVPSPSVAGVLASTGILAGRRRRRA
jgi:hypothetical protein